MSGKQSKAQRRSERRALARRDTDRRLETLQREEAQALIATQVSYWSGPFPSPEVVERYTALLPDAAHRFVSMAERQQVHRQNLEAMAVGAGIRRAYFGQAAAFLIFLSGIGGGVYLLAHGMKTGGLVAIIGALTTMAGVFIYGRQSTKKQLEAKDPASTGGETSARQQLVRRGNSKISA